MTCGTCTLCCKTLRVDELGKPGNSWCAHCSVGKGCEIYNDRPQSCRDFECVWLQSQRHGKLPLELRPDQSRVLMTATTDGNRLVFVVDPSRPDAANRPAVRRLIDKLVRDGRPPLVVPGEWVASRASTTTAATDAPTGSPSTTE